MCVYIMNLTPQYMCKPGMAYTCVRLLKGIYLTRFTVDCPIISYK